MTTQHLARPVLGGDVLEPGPHDLRRAEHDAPPRCRLGFSRLVEERERLLDRRHGDELPAAQQRDRHVGAGREALGLLVGLGADGGDAYAQLGLRAPPRRLEVLAVEARVLGAVRVDEVGDRVRKPELPGPDRALRRGAEQPDVGLARGAGQGGEPREEVAGREVVLDVGQELGQLLGEVVG